MSLRIRFQGGTLAGQFRSFGDEIETITIGRDSARCQVVFPPEEAHVGREHCALVRELGRYRLKLNGEDRVFVNGREGYHEEELPASADLRLGPKGPQIVAETISNSTLVPTVGRGEHQPGVGTRIDQAKRRSRSGLRLALLAIAGILMASVVGYHYYEKSKIDIEGSAPELADQMNKAKDSVYLVLVKNSQGGEFADGTAWVVGDHTLVTNCHVAETFLNALSPSEKLCARSPSNPPRDFEVTSVTLHPGYKSFARIVSARAPAQLGLSEDERMALVPACDVALMTVKGPGSLGTPLRLATDEDLGALKAGQTIGMVGYPSESITGHNTANPEPSAQVGHIARQTDFLMRTDQAGDALQLLHHSAPETGGSSGSPILNAHGSVIAVNSAANFTFLPSGSRVPSAASLNFAQRSDLVRELVENRAQAAQLGRDDRWRQELKKFEVLPDEDSAREAAVKGWTQNGTAGQAVEVLRRTVNLVKPEYLRKYQGEVDFAVTANSSYLIYVYSQEGAGVDISVYSSAIGTMARVVRSNMMRTSVPYVAQDTGNARLALSGSQGSSVDVAVYRMSAADVPGSGQTVP